MESQMATNQVKQHSLFTEFDIGLFKSGKHFRLYEKFGSHLVEVNKVKGTYFAVWAPNAGQVQVIGDFNHWQGAEHQLSERWDGSGIWEGLIPGLGAGTVYKYKLFSSNGQILEKGDPFAKLWEVPPKTASVVWSLDHAWKDKKWLKKREQVNALNQPFAVYEVHLGSWKRKQPDYHSLSYEELAEELVSYVKKMGFTHVEFMPVMEHPFFGSWGYQVTGYFAPSSRYGTPQELMHLIDQLHQNDIGVILDWVPSHFPGDAHGLINFDGTSLYEHSDPKQGYHPDWSSYIFNYGRSEVRSFLISNAIFWLDHYHADGLRVDAVASMLYLDYSRDQGEWIPNIHGGRENLEAVSLLKEMNEEVYRSFSGVQTIAEESTAWPNVSQPTYNGGLGFGMKWMMGWMHDTLEYFKKDPIYRQHHHNDITFSLAYVFSENFMLPLSHDEVVYGKGALIDRMPGDEWQRFANMRLLYGYMYAHPGTKLIFMGGEFGQTSEWDHDHSLDWELLQYAPHQGLQKLVTDLNWFYRQHPALYDYSFEPQGFEWIDLHNSGQSVIIFLRKGHDPHDNLLVVCNFTPSVYEHFKVGIHGAGFWKEVFNSDGKEYGGSGATNSVRLQAIDHPSHGKPQSIEIMVPPLSICIFKGEYE